MTDTPRARHAFGDRAEFHVGDATRLDDDLRNFDVVQAFGAIHHLDDQSALRLLSRAMTYGLVQPRWC